VSHHVFVHLHFLSTFEAKLPISFSAVDQDDGTKKAYYAI
jgi:hypothetical protein